MNWLLIVTIAYFLIALEVVLDKFLLSSKRVSHPAIYTFYSGLLSFTALALFPFGFHQITILKAVFAIASGIVFAYGILAMFFAIKESEASRVTPVVGAVTPIITLIFCFLFLDEKLSSLQFYGVITLVFGGLLISAESLIKGKRKFFSGFYHSVLAGVLLAFAFTFFKGFYRQDNFINVFIWTRFGLMAGALSLFLVPAWRRAIILSLTKFKKPEKENKKSGVLFVLNKALGGAGSILLNFSISLASVTIINALVSTEYIFIFLMGIVFSWWTPNVFREKRDWVHSLQKVSAIILITLGIALVSGFKFKELYGIF